MTREEHLAVLRTYAQEFKNWEPERVDRHRNHPVGMGMGIKHAIWMTHEMIRRLEADEESSPGQADRWLGFIQAIFWQNGLCSIDDMAKTNVPPQETASHDST